MPKQTKKQFDDLLSKTTTQMKDEIAKREVVTFRLDEQSLKCLQEIAISRRKHVGVLVRECIIEYLQNQTHQEDNAGKILQIVENSNKQIRVLQKEIEHLSQYIHALEKRVS